jgi:hypothetical protein
LFFFNAEEVSGESIYFNGNLFRERGGVHNVCNGYRNQFYKVARNINFSNRKFAMLGLLKLWRQPNH